MITKLTKRLNHAMTSEYWRVAVRPLREGMKPLWQMAGEDQIKGFWIMPGKSHVNYADPFLFEYKGKTWLFYERQNLTDMHGNIWCRCLEPTADPDIPHGDGIPFMVLNEPFHLSYPQVIEFEGGVYMIPESREVGRVSLYACDSFPGGFTYRARVLEEPSVDTTICIEGETLYLYAYTYNSLRIYRAGLDYLRVLCAGREASEAGINAPVLIWESPVSKLLRPGGSLFDSGSGQWLRPAQDCREYYGRALSFVKGEHSITDNYMSSIDTGVVPGTGELILPELLLFDYDGVDAIGLHTYNATSGYEAVDILQRHVSPGVILKKIEWTVRNRVDG